METKNNNPDVCPKLKALEVFIMPHWTIDYFFKHSQD